MEKKEKKADLEQLLNTLIEKGWKPFGDGTAYDTKHGFFHPGCGWVYRTLRELVSKESGLWQFVCENKLQPTNRSGSWEYSDGYTGWTCIAYQFRLIESALKDESELESFLLENIKVD